MSLARFDLLVWALIYVGMFLFALGFSVARDDTVLGWSIAGAGVIAAVVGAVLVVVRSRMKRRT